MISSSAIPNNSLLASAAALPGSVKDPKPIPQQLTVIETGDGDDQVNIHTNRDGSVDVNINGSKQTFTAAEARDLVSRGLVINTRGGNDSIIISGERLPGSESGGIQITSGDGNDYVSVNHGNCYINGGDGNDRIYGSSGSDTILGGLGADTIFGMDGNDRIDGGYGMYTDRLFGGNGNDRIVDRDGFNNQLSGGAGDDLLIGGINADFLYGGAGDDVLVGGNTHPLLAIDYYDEGEGDDHIYRTDDQYYNSDDYDNKNPFNVNLIAGIAAR